MLEINLFLLDYLYFSLRKDVELFLSSMLTMISLLSIFGIPFIIFAALALFDCFVIPSKDDFKFTCGIRTSLSITET